MTSEPSPFETYAARIECLDAKPCVVAPHVDAVGAAHHWWPCHRSWQRSVVRFHPPCDPSPTPRQTTNANAPYATLLFETEGAPQALCHVDVFANRPDEADTTRHEADAPSDRPRSASARSVVAAVPPLGWLRLSAFPNDPALPSLMRVWRDLPNAHVVRYRPRMRCTLRGSAVDGRVVYAKVFADVRDGRAIHATGVALWAAASRGDLRFRVAEPLRFDEADATLWQAAVAGLPAKPTVLGPQGVEVARQLGQALASMRHVDVVDPQRYDAAWQFERTRVYAGDLAVRLPDSAALVDDVLAGLARMHARLEPRDLQPIHGAPHPSQWLVDADGCSLVDFDRSGLGDPELDVATFVAEVDFEGRTSQPTEAINAAFVAGFESAAGKLDPLRLELYRMHKHVAKALRIASRLRSNAPDRATRLLRRCAQSMTRIGSLIVVHVSNLAAELVGIDASLVAMVV